MSKRHIMAALWAAAALSVTGCTPADEGGDNEPNVQQDMGEQAEDMDTSANNNSQAMEDMGGQAEEDMAAGEDMASGEEDMAAAQMTYYKDIKPIVFDACESCHVPQGAGPYALDTYDALVQNADVALAAIDAGYMPPWSPDPECRSYKGERLIADEDVDRLRAWLEAGAPEGDPADWTAPEVEELPEPNLIGSQNGAYTPDGSYSDDYHCFLIDLTFEEDTFVTGTNVLPGNDQLVHHANLFLINPTYVPMVEELQDRDPDAGYSCFGDAGINQTSIIGAWVPGAQPIFTPDDTAIVIPKGSRLVLQVHYNTLYTDPAPVDSKVQLYTTDETPQNAARAMPIANLTFTVPPGEKRSEHTMIVRNASDKDWTIIGTAPHLHLLATEVSVEVLRKDEDEPNECLIDIPEWDFNWQQEYRFHDDEWVKVHPGDRVKLTCVFDNSPENQPVVDGNRLTPQEVGWGGKTQDEMCLSFLVALEDYDPSAQAGPLCSEFKQCRSQCEDQFDIGCIFNCAVEEYSCGECLLFGAQDCAFAYCRNEVRAATPCLLTCAQGAQAGGNLDACLSTECPMEYGELDACLRPYIEQGLCNQYIDDCNVEF